MYSVHNTVNPGMRCISRMLWCHGISACSRLAPTHLRGGCRDACAFLPAHPPNNGALPDGGIASGWERCPARLVVRAHLLAGTLRPTA